MSFALTQAIIDLTGIPLAAKAVLVVLARHARDDGTNERCPSVQTIAAKAGLSDKGARNALRALEAGGLIVALSRKVGGRSQATPYRICTERFGPPDTRHDVPRKTDKTRHDVPPNGHDTRHHVPPSHAETRNDVPLNPERRSAEEVLNISSIEGSPVCELEPPAGAPAREGDTHTGTPAISQNGKVVPFRPRSPEVLPLPDDWALPDDWRAWALSVGWQDVDGAAERFRNHWLGKRDRGDRDAANSEAGWLREWKGWINGNLNWKRKHEQQRHDNRRGHGDLASVVKSDCPAWFGNAAGGKDPW